MKLNQVPKVDGVQTSRMKLPDWAGRAKEMLPASSGTTLDKVSSMSPDTLRIRGVNVTEGSSSFNPSGLMGSGIYDDPITLDTSELNEWARTTTPVEDEPDVTDWMVPAKAQISHLKARAREYDRAGSSMTVAAGDPYMPGVNNGQLAFKSERGDTVSERGTAEIITGGDKFDLEVPGSRPIVGKNLLGWGVGSNLQDKQWVGGLLSVEEITANPDSPIAFPTIEGETGPLFVGHVPSRPAILNRTSVGIMSSEPQTLEFKFRDTSDYTNEVRSFSQDIPKGQSTVSFRMLGLGIEPMVADIRTENGTKAVLTDYSVFP